MMSQIIEDPFSQLKRNAPSIVKAYHKEEKVPCKPCSQKKQSTKVSASDGCNPCNASAAFCIIKLGECIINGDGTIPKFTEKQAQLVLNQLALPQFPSGLAAYDIEQFLIGLTNRIISYQYLPFVIIIIIAIWLMVAAGWITIVTGIILTIVFLAIIYFFFVSFRVSVKSFVEDYVSTVSAGVDAYRTGLLNAIERIPYVIGYAACLLVGAENNPRKPYCQNDCTTCPP